MRLRVGSSGFSYKEWRGSFYPESLSPKKFLEHYAEHFTTVEINNTFYRMPKRELLAGWAERVPADFRFVLKAPQRITHKAKLANAEDDVAHFYAMREALGERAGPVLFQLPPWLRADIPLLEAFLAALPEDARAAFEFRHESWQDEKVTSALRDAGQVLCVAETDDQTERPELVATADWGYLRLRANDYDDAELDAWCGAIRSQPWSEVFVFFKHEDEGRAPRLAQRLAERFGG
jgi:uncharacterized protein YecE (DUF72 family)